MNGVKPCFDTLNHKAYRQAGNPIFGEPTIRRVLAFVTVVSRIARPLVNDMGDKSPRSKDKTKKQASTKKAKAKAKAKKKSDLQAVVKKS